MPTCDAALNLEKPYAVLEYQSLPVAAAGGAGQKCQLLVRNPRLSFELLGRFDLGATTTEYELTHSGFLTCDDVVGSRPAIREFTQQFGDVAKPGSLTLKVQTARGEESWPLGYCVLTSLVQAIDVRELSVVSGVTATFNARSDYVLVSKEVSGQREWTVLRVGELRATRHRLAILASLTQVLGAGEELSMFYSPDDGKPTYDVKGASLESLLVNAVWAQTQRLNRPWSETVQAVRATIQDLAAQLGQAEDALRNAQQPLDVV